MDARDVLTAYEIVNSFRQDEIARILYEYGEEWQSRRIAKAIFDRRKKDRIRTARELAGIVASVKRKRERYIRPRRHSRRSGSPSTTSWGAFLMGWTRPWTFLPAAAG
jgi:16S rRNA C1402 N4-methylase RsmH